MAKRPNKTSKTAPKKGRAWFERKVAELKREMAKLPAGRQEELMRKLEEEREH